MEQNNMNVSAKNEVTLSGNMGVGGILFSVLAWAAPLLVVAGQMPTIIAVSKNSIVMGYGIVMLILIFFAIGFTTITRYVENPGAYYAYITAGLGKEAGLGAAFVTVCTYLVMMANWIAFGVFLRQFIENSLNGPAIPWYICSIFGALCCAFFAHFSIELSAKVLAVLLACEVIVIIIFDASVFIDKGVSGLSMEPFTIEGMTTGNVGIALLYGTLCFIGFESTAIYREEARDPEKTIPRATYLALIVIGVFYVISSWMMVSALGPQGVADANLDQASTMFNDLAGVFVNSTFPKISSILLITSTFACQLSIHNALTRYAYSLGKDGILPKVLSTVHPKHKSPYKASLICSTYDVVFILVLTIIFGFDAAGGKAFNLFMRMNGIATLAVIMIICLVCASIIVYFRRNEIGKKIGVFRTLVAPIIGSLGLLIVLSLALINLDELTGLPLGISLLFALAIPAIFFAGFIYARKLRISNVEIYKKIGRQ